MRVSKWSQQEFAEIHQKQKKSHFKHIRNRNQFGVQKNQFSCKNEWIFIWPITKMLALKLLFMIVNSKYIYIHSYSWHWNVTRSAHIGNQSYKKHTRFMLQSKSNLYFVFVIHFVLLKWSVTSINSYPNYTCWCSRYAWTIFNFP